MTTVDDLFSANPFPGLRPFATTEADRFFGRRQQIEELVARLDEVSFVAVAGSSGCGKSSLVLAGLLSALECRTEAGDKANWRPAVMRPGSEPIAKLAEQLAPVLDGSRGNEESRQGTLYGRLRLGGLGLVEAVSLARLEPSTRVLVVVDQFEEIFRFRRMTDADEASAFVKLLLNATSDRQSPVSVVITLRSDSLGYCADFRDLPETINRGQYLVPKLTREQRKEAIVKPIEVRGFTITPRLVQRLLNDVSDDFDDLPVMQHALTRTWNRWAAACQGARPIDLEDYEAVGTTRQALSNHADEAFGSLPSLKPVVEKMFRALTERVGGATEIRRPLDFDRLCQVVGADRGQVEQGVERFRRPDTAFLMPSREVPLADKTVIDISHESLIRQWERLRKWAQAEAESRAMLLRLVDAARRHEAGQGSLWRGPELAKALDWRAGTEPTPAWVGLSAGGDGASAWESVKRFLAGSAAEARRERRRRRLLVGGLPLALVISLAGAVVANNLQKQAKSRELATRALLEIDQDPARSAYFALAAVDRDPENRRAKYALRQSLATLEVAHAEKILPHGRPVLDARYTRDGSRLVTASGKAVTIFDTGTFEPVRAPLVREADVLKAWLIASNTLLVTQTQDGPAQIQRVDGTIARRISCEGDEDSVYTISVSPDERHVALGCYKGRVLVWDATRPAEPPRVYSRNVEGPGIITAVAFSGDGEYLASGDFDGVVNVWTLDHPGAGIGQGSAGAKDSPIKHGRAIRDIGFHPDRPDLLVTAGDDRQAIVWQLDLKRRRLDLAEPNQPRRWQLEHERPVIAAKFASRGERSNQVITVSDKRARLWEPKNADARQVRGHDDWVTDANASADGELLVTASADGTARIWSTRSGAPIAVLRGHRDEVTRAVISPDGNQVVTASMDGTVRVWRFRAPRLLSFSKRWALSAAFEPKGGARVAVGEERGGGTGPASVLELNKLVDGPVPVRHDLPADRVDGGDPKESADAVSVMSWSRDRRLIVGLRNSHEIDLSVQPVLWDVEGHRNMTPEWLTKCYSAVFSPGTDELLTVSREGRIAVWDAKGLDRADLRPKLEFEKKPGRWMAAMSPDGKWIAALEGDRVMLWRREESQVAPREPKGPAGTVKCDEETRSYVTSMPRELKGHAGTVKSLEFSRDGRWLLTASSDRTARIWPVDPPGPPKVLRGGHTAGLFSASFDPDGKRVVTGSADSTIRVWDAETGTELAALRWHSEGVNDVRFSPDGNWILSASDDGTVKLGQCEACNLTVEELRKRVPELAKLPKTELEEIQRETDVAVRYLGLPAFLWREDGQDGKSRPQPGALPGASQFSSKSAVSRSR